VVDKLTDSLAIKGVCDSGISDISINKAFNKDDRRKDGNFAGKT
jgi:hypothetical protein